MNYSSSLSACQPPGKCYKLPVQPRFVVFVCQNLRPPTDQRGSCQMRGSEKILEKLKAARKAGNLETLYRATSSGCLGGCEAGPTVLVALTGSAATGEPSDVTTYSGFRAENVEELIEQHLKNGQVIERLRSRPEWLD